MDSIVAYRQDRLKVPRPDAYHLAASQASDAMHCQASCLVTVLLVRSFPVLFQPCGLPRLLQPLLTSRSHYGRPLASPLLFAEQPQGEISPGKGTRSFTAQPPHLRRLAFGHKSFAVDCLLALAGAASDAIRVPRLTVYAPRFLPTLGRPHAVALHLPRCGQLGRGLAPRRSRPCWAHNHSDALWHREDLQRRARECQADRMQQDGCN